MRTEGLLSAHRYQLPEGAYLASLALAQQGQTAQAQLELRQLAAAWPGTPLAGAAILAQADALLSSLPDLAVTHYRTYLREFPEGPERARAIAGISAAYAHLGQFPEALDVLRDANLSVPAALQAVVDTPPRWRRPGVAKALAIVPGVGHLYAGSPRPALSAFTVNLVFAAGVAVAVRQESWGTAGVLGFFGLGFYIGNIYGAGEAAMRHNRRIRDGVERSYAQSGILPDSPVLPDERWITPAP